MEYQLVREITIPMVALAIGATLIQSEKTNVAGKLAMFFGAQTVMNLYMKEVLSRTIVSEEKGLEGIPSAFIITAIQQLVAFTLFGIWLLVLQCTPYAYWPKRLSSPMEILAVLIFSLSFTMNIALNNYSLTLLPLSVNLIIRSCLPLATFISQQTASSCTNEPVKETRPLELVLMFIGVLCVVIVVVAESHSKDIGHGESESLGFGVLVCVASIFSGGINLALAGVLGTSIELNPLDTTVYMSIPAFMLLLIPTFAYRHPVNWPGHGSMTDWEIIAKVAELNPKVVPLILMSGVFTLFYNVFLYGIVQNLSASYTAFAGNFNKAAIVALGLLVGLEKLSPDIWGVVTVLGFLGNIGAFTAYNCIKLQTKRNKGMPFFDPDDGGSMDGNSPEGDYDTDDDDEIGYSKAWNILSAH